MKKYTKPTIEQETVEIQDVIAESGTFNDTDGTLFDFFNVSPSNSAE